MNTYTIKLTSFLNSFSEVPIDLLKEEYNTKQTLNNLFNSIISQDNKQYPILFRENYFRRILSKINSEFSQEEKKLLLLFCLIRSYGNYMEEFINELLKRYEEIKDLTFSFKYFNFIKYRIEFSLFCFMVLNSTQQHPREILSHLKMRVDEGNITFKNY